MATVKHTLKSGIEIEIIGYCDFDTMRAKAQINGKWYNGELLSPEQMSSTTRANAAKIGGEGYWCFDAVIIPPEKGQELRKAIIEEEESQAFMDRALLDGDIESGVAFRTAEITGQFGSELMWARRLTAEEKANYGDWFRDLCMVGYKASGRITVSAQAIRQVVGNRHSDGQFRGTDNEAWTITEDEWNKIIEISTALDAKTAERVAAYEAAEKADIQRKIDSGYCFACESYCYSDCGHYSNEHLLVLAYIAGQEETTKNIEDEWNKILEIHKEG